MSGFDALPSASFLGRSDPRLRVVAGVGLTVLLAVAQDLRALVAGGTGLGLLCLAGRLPARTMGARLLRINLLLAGLFPLLAFIPVPSPGRIWPVWTLTPEGLDTAWRVLIKGNAMVLGLSALIGTVDATSLGHALAHLHVPTKLVHLMLFTTRYLDVLGQEHHRMRMALRARGFRMRPSRRTWTMLGKVAAMILVRSLQRSDQVLAAMKCRGFQGRFHLLHHFQARPADAGFALLLAIFAAGVAWLEWA